MKSLSLSSTRIVHFAGALCAAAAAAAAADRPPVEITPGLLDRLVVEARSQNPALQGAAARVRAASAAAGAIRTWEDPTASFGVWSPGRRGFGSAEQGNLIYGLDEKLPLYRRPELMRKAAAAEQSKEQLSADAETQQVRRRIAEALTALALASRQSALAREDLGWLDVTVSAVDHRYRVGEASQVDWLKMQTARATATDELITKEREREHAAFTLNRLLGRGLHDAWPELAVPPLQPAIYYTPALVAAAVAADPELQVMRQDTNTAQAAADLTRRERLPDISVGLQAWQYSGDGGLRQATATVSFSVPWLNKGKHQADWRRDQERRRATELAAEDFALSVREELHHHTVDLDAARRQALLYQEQLVPLTRQTLASAETLWEHNRGPFQDVLEAHRMLIADELALARALAEQSTLLAEIAYLTGSRDLGSLLALGGNPTASHLEPSVDTSR